MKGDLKLAPAGDERSRRPRPGRARRQPDARRDLAPARSARAISATTSRTTCARRWRLRAPRSSAGSNAARRSTSCARRWRKRSFISTARRRPSAPSCAFRRWRAADASAASAPSTFRRSAPACSSSTSRWRTQQGRRHRAGGAAAGAGARRRGPAARSDFQPRRQCDQVHAGRRARADRRRGGGRPGDGRSERQRLRRAAAGPGTSSAASIAAGATAPRRDTAWV